MKGFVSLTFASILAVTGSAWAAGDAASAPAANGSVTQASTEMTEGEVRKIDRDNKKITLRHGEIKNLGMPPMSMVFQMKDPSMLEKFKAGDKVQFTADNINGAITVIAIEPVKN